MKLNFVKAYYAVVSAIAVLVIGFSLVELLQFFVLYFMPELVEADMARLSAEQSGMEQVGPVYRHIMPLYSDLIRTTIRIVVFALLLWWHLPRLLAKEKLSESHTG